MLAISSVETLYSIIISIDSTVDFGQRRWQSAGFNKQVYTSRLEGEAAQQFARFAGGSRVRLLCRLIGRKWSLEWTVCVCVCVFFPLILDIKFVGRTSRGHTGGRSHRFSHPPSFCGACLNFSREKNSAIPFPRRP